MINLVSKYSTLILLALVFAKTSHCQSVTTIAGQVDQIGNTDGFALNATFNNPHGLEVASDGTVYIADRFNHLIRKIDLDGNVYTIAGIAGVIGVADGPGNLATFNEPWGLCVDENHNVFVADTRNNLIRKIDSNGLVTTIAGSGTLGAYDALGTTATFGNPTGIDVDSIGNLYIADHVTHIIRKIDTFGMVTTIAGTALSYGSLDGPGSVAKFYRPYGLTLDRQGNIIVADEWNHKIRKIDANGMVTTIAGNGIIGNNDANGSSATFNYPWDVTVDMCNNIYVGDGYNNTIRKIDTLGNVTTIIGVPGVYGASDGIGPNASFNGITAIDYFPATDELYIADPYNQLIRKASGIKSGIALSVTNASNPDVIGETNFEICFGETFEISLTPSDLDQYFYYIDQNLISVNSNAQFLVENLPEGNHEIKVISTVDGITVISNSIQVTVLEAVTADFQLSSNFITVGEFVQFTTNYSADITTDWNFGDGNISQDENPNHLYDDEGVYSVTLIASNLVGCSDSISISNAVRVVGEDETIIEDDEENQEEDDEGGENENQAIDSNEIFIPSAFSPNADGLNDVFLVRGFVKSNFNLKVFNEWGQVVFNSSNQNVGWNGNFNDKPVKEDTYVYQVYLENLSGEKQYLSGNITIIR